MVWTKEEKSHPILLVQIPSMPQNGIKIETMFVKKNCTKVINRSLDGHSHLPSSSCWFSNVAGCAKIQRWILAMEWLVIVPDRSMSRRKSWTWRSGRSRLASRSYSPPGFMSMGKYQDRAGSTNVCQQEDWKEVYKSIRELFVRPQSRPYLEYMWRQGERPWDTTCRVPTCLHPIVK